ncbi:MAG: hypothetical protein HRU40_13290 [Saprospiraceae bacterium]|nr:hypothetical protein [Saprospiraceae bacterium]
MCGIVAVFSGEHCNNAIEIGNLALQKLHHRGDSRFQNEAIDLGNVYLGCNRLPFTSDIKQQPVVSMDNRYFLILNGEVYDYHNNEQLSDTELLLNQIIELGIKSIFNTDGMFAGIFCDKHLNKAYAFRDPIGIKPLYYAFSKDSELTILASEVKAISGLENIESIRHVRPGSLIEIDCATKSFVEILPEEIKQNINVNTYDKNHQLTYELIEKSILKQTNDGHKYGVYLSGGIDSSIIYYVLKKHGRNVIPFVMGNSKSDDRKFALELTKSFHEEAVIVPCPDENQLLSTIKSIIYYAESFEPNVIRQSAVNWILSNAAQAHGIKVTICGEGADELFGGYPEFCNDYESFAETRNNFLKDLHRTQLQRVDRVNMAANIETRVPYLAKEIIEYALSSGKGEDFLNLDIENGIVETKIPLRRAVKDKLPDSIVNRPKMVFSEGAGIGGNHPVKGMFCELINGLISKAETEIIIKNNKSWNLKSKEEVFYFKIFAEFGYTKYTDAKDRVFANKILTR